MKKQLFGKTSPETIARIKETAMQLAANNIDAQKKQIRKDSPYSAQINEAFAGYEEFAYLCSLGLAEAEVTRRSLVREIDFDLYITDRQKTNRELMQQGLSPYAADDLNSCIVLHHIGQSEDAPFAELTAAEHMQYGNNKTLHGSIEESWRSDPERDRKYMAEKSAYWKKRAKKDIVLFGEKPYVPCTAISAPQKDFTHETQKVIEQLFAECSIEELNYISNLAQSYILTKEIGARSIEEFILKMNDDSVSTIRCPVCGSQEISLYGSYRTDAEKRQKYKCKGCGKIFSAFYNTIIQGCTLSFFEWIRFIDCLYNGYSVKKTAQICEMSEQAAFHNRLRLFYALSILDEQVILEGHIAIDETYVPVSYKGNHTQQEDFSMPRAARNRGHENHIPGTSKNQACIICALDGLGNVVGKVSGFGSPKATIIDRAISKHIDATKLCSLYSDKSSAIRSFAQGSGFPIQQVCLAKLDYENKESYETRRQIQRINAHHSRLKKFLRNFNGISSELLQGYVSLFSWKDRNRDRSAIEAYKELLTIMVTPNLYKSIEQLSNERLGLYRTELKGDDESYFFQSIESRRKSEKIYAMYAQGFSQAEIARELGCSRQAINRRIQQFATLGLSYKTEREKLEESKNSVLQEYEIEKLNRYREHSDKWMEMLEKKERWVGDINKFWEKMEKEYSVSRQTIKNNIAYAKRIKNLREIFYIGKQYEYLSLREVFESVYRDYVELRASEPAKNPEQCYAALSQKYKYTKNMVIGIVLGMQNNSIDWEGKLKIKIPMAHTLNRDRSVFIDCLKWTGTRAEFIKYATQKYHISRRTIYEILMLNIIADPNRYEISKHDYATSGTAGNAAISQKDT